MIRSKVVEQYLTIFTHENGKKIKKLILLIDESILYLERERDKQKRRGKYYSSICFQCFMFTKWKVGKLVPQRSKSMLKNAEH